MDPIQCARSGDTEFFKNLASDVHLNSTDEVGDSVLSIAASENRLACCEAIYTRSSSLVYHQNKYGSTALHNAVWRGNIKAVRFLVAKTESECREDIESGLGDRLPTKKLLTMVDFRRETSLHKAVQRNHVQIAKLLIKADCDGELLRMVNREKDSGLHLAVKAHNLEMVKLLVEADLDLEYCANASGETPLLIAMAQAQSHGNVAANSSGAIRKFLLEKQPYQSTVPIGNNGWTSLHYATSKGDLSAIKDIIRFCFDCLELVDVKKQNFLHLAAMLNHVTVVEHILSVKGIPDSVLNQKDNDGNTPLHVAALNGNASAALCLLYDARVDKKTMNVKGQRVLEAINFGYEKERAGVRDVRDKVDEKELSERSQFDLVVGALIATVSFTAGITVPGGFISDGPHKGMAILCQSASFEAFVLSNTCALLLSLAAVLSHFCTRYLFNKKDIDFNVALATSCILAAIVAMVIAFITGSYAVLSMSDRLAIGVNVLCSGFFVFLFYSMWRIAVQYDAVSSFLHSKLFGWKCNTDRQLNYQSAKSSKMEMFNSNSEDSSVPR